MKLRLIWRTQGTRPRASTGSGSAPADDRRLVRRRPGAVVGFLSTGSPPSTRKPGAAGEPLTAALDYRGWHEFGIQRYSGGQGRISTGPASGGERVLAASVPLFAAASSHYSSAGTRTRHG